MPAIRAPALRTALHPSGRGLSRTQPFLTQIRRESGPGKSEHKGPTTGYRLDGTSSLTSNRSLLYVGGVAAVLGAVYFVGLSKPDKAAAAGISNDPNAVKHRTGSDRQRVGGPERSEK